MTCSCSGAMTQSGNFLSVIQVLILTSSILQGFLSVHLWNCLLRPVIFKFIRFSAYSGPYSEASELAD